MDDLDKKRRPGPATDEEVVGLLLKAAKPKQDARREVALLDRIVAAAERTPRVVAPAPRVHPVAEVPVAKVLVSVPVRTAATRRKALLSRNESWGAAGLLAASLMIGFLAGQTTLSQSTLQRLADASGVSLTAATQDIATVLASAEQEEDD